MPQGATSSTSIPANDAPLSPAEQVRLQKYLELLRSVRKEGYNNRGSTHDLLDLLARASSINKTITRASNLAFQEIDANPHIHQKLSKLRTVEGVERVQTTEMRAEIEALRGDTLVFGQYKPEAFNRVTEETANGIIEQIREHAPTLFRLLFSLC